MATITLGSWSIKLSDMEAWPAPNLVNPPVKGHELVPLMSVLLALSTIALYLRLYSRAFILRRFGTDDILLIPGYLAAISLTVSEIHSLHGGWGRHIYDIDLKYAKLLTLCGYITQLSFAISVTFTKLSILVSYFRFATPRFRPWVWATIIFVTAWSVVFIVAAVMPCIPVHLYWDTYQRTPDMKCLEPSTVRILQYTQGGLNVLSDFMVLVLPLPTLWSLSIPRQQKWTLAVLLALWSIASVAAILRLISIVRTMERIDSAWYGYDLWIYNGLETHLAVVCACAPGVKPLIARIWPKFDNIRRRRPSTAAPAESAQLDLEENGVESRARYNGTRTSNRFSDWNTANATSLAGSEVSLQRQPAICVVGRVSPFRASRIFPDFLQFPKTPSCHELNEATFKVRTVADERGLRKQSVELPPPPRCVRAQSPESTFENAMSITKTTDVDDESCHEREHW